MKMLTTIFEDYCDGILEYCLKAILIFHISGDEDSPDPHLVERRILQLIARRSTTFSCWFVVEVIDVYNCKPLVAIASCKSWLTIVSVNDLHNKPPREC